MIVFVDMREAKIPGIRFAYWDTITDGFLGTDMAQGWDTFDEILDDDFDRETMRRLHAITPEWCKRSIVEPEEEAAP
jgi:hypothetical protein